MFKGETATYVFDSSSGWSTIANPPEDYMKPAEGIPLEDLSKDAVKDLSLPDWSEASEGATLQLVAHVDEVSLFDEQVFNRHDNPKEFSGFHFLPSYNSDRVIVTINGVDFLTSWDEKGGNGGSIFVADNDEFTFYGNGTWSISGKGSQNRFLISARVPDLDTARLVPEWVDPRAANA